MFKIVVVGEQGKQVSEKNPTTWENRFAKVNKKELLKEFY